MNVPQTAIDLIKLREGNGRPGHPNEPYADSLGNITGGYGHLMSESEAAQYPQHRKIPQDVIDGWFAYDSLAAYQAALKQAQVLGVTDPHFIDVLTSVNFQMGHAWFVAREKGGKGFVHTWALLKAHKWEEAAFELEHSAWYHQSKTRVEDFQHAIQGLIK